ARATVPSTLTKMASVFKCSSRHVAGAVPDPTRSGLYLGRNDVRTDLGDHVSPKPTDSPPHHPVVMAHQAQRATSVQLRIADTITAFAGSMPFVYVHIALFGIWMLFIESNPWPMLTLIVSLEAIFLSTFVMIGQNRQAAFQQAKADHEFNEQELELKTN